MSGHKGGYDKYELIRKETGEKCGGFFALRPVTDLAAIAALWTYAATTHNPRLRKDLRIWLTYLERGEDIDFVEALERHKRDELAKLAKSLAPEKA